MTRLQQELGGSLVRKGGDSAIWWGTVVPLERTHGWTLAEMMAKGRNNRMLTATLAR